MLLELEVPSTAFFPCCPGGKQCGEAERKRGDIKWLIVTIETDLYCYGIVLYMGLPYYYYMGENPQARSERRITNLAANETTADNL